MTPIQNLALIFGTFLLLVYIIWRNLRIWAYVGFDASRAGEENYFLCDGIADDIQIQAAIDYVSSKRSILPRIINLGKGVFEITSALYLRNRTWLVGTTKKNHEVELTRAQKEWNEWVNSLYGDPKYKYHKDHPKHLSNNSSTFRDFQSLATRTNEK